MFDEIAQGLMENYDGSYLGDAGSDGDDGEEVDWEDTIG
jgi:hypothetical protein